MNVRVLRQCVYVRMRSNEFNEFDRNAAVKYWSPRRTAFAER